MLNVIIIDDDEEVLHLLKYKLEKLGAHCKVYIEPDSAIVSATLKRPDLVICDFKMPVYNGIDVFDQINNNPFELPVPFVILSGADNHRAEIEREGIEFISKTSGFESVIETIVNKLPVAS